MSATLLQSFVSQLANFNDDTVLPVPLGHDNITFAHTFLRVAFHNCILHIIKIKYIF